MSACHSNFGGGDRSPLPPAPRERRWRERGKFCEVVSCRFQKNRSNRGLVEVLVRLFEVDFTASTRLPPASSVGAGHLLVEVSDSNQCQVCLDAAPRLHEPQLRDSCASTDCAGLKFWRCRAVTRRSADPVSASSCSATNISRTTRLKGCCANARL